MISPATLTPPTVTLTTAQMSAAIIDSVGIDKFIGWMCQMRKSTAITPEQAVVILYRNHVK